MDLTAGIMPICVLSSTLVFNIHMERCPNLTKFFASCKQFSIFYLHIGRTAFVFCCLYIFY